MPTLDALKTYLDGLVARFEQPAFIQDDPIAIPHGFDDPRDQEVIGAIPQDTVGCVPLVRNGS